MLMIKKSRRNGTFILYDNHNFQYHTHVKRKDLAVIILNNVTYHRVPKSHNIEFIKSHLRVSIDTEYCNLLTEYINLLSKVS